MTHIFTHFKPIGLLLFIFWAQLSLAFNFNGYQIADLELKQDSNQWTLSSQQSSNKVTPDSSKNLGGQSILGTAGQSTNGEYFERTYTDLPPHEVVSFRITSFYYSTSSGPIQHVDFMFDDVTVIGEIISSDVKNVYFVKGRVPHSGSSLRVKIISRLNSPSDQEWFDFSDFHIAFANVSKVITPSLCAYSNPFNEHTIDKLCYEYPDVGYYQDANSGTTKHIKDQRCFDAFNETLCLRCEKSYIFNGTACSKCPEHCTSCYEDNNRLKCTACTPDHILTKDAACKYLRRVSSGRDDTSIKTNTITNKYIQYVTVALPPNLQGAVTNKRPPLSLQFGISMSEGMESSFRDQNMPAAWRNRGLHSSFLVNFWEQLITLCIIVVAALFFTVLENFCQRRGWHTAQAVFCNLRVLTRCNFLLIMIGVDIPDIIFFASLELRTLHLDSALSVISFLICLGMLAVTLVFLQCIYLLAKAALKASSSGQDSNEAFFKKWEGFQIFFSGFKQDRLVTQLFYLCYIVRVLVSALLGATLYAHPTAQSVLQVILNILIIGLIAHTKPLKKTINFIQILLREGITLITNICVLALSISISDGSEQSKTSKTLGDIIIFGNECVNIVLIAFLINKLTTESVKIYELQKGNQKVPKTIWMQLLAVILQQGGMGFEEIQIPEFYTQQTKLNKVSQASMEEKLMDSAFETKLANSTSKGIEISSYSPILQAKKTRAISPELTKTPPEPVNDFEIGNKNDAGRPKHEDINSRLARLKANASTKHVPISSEIASELALPDQGSRISRKRLSRRPPS